MVAYLDPVVLISAMAAVSKSVAFGITSSTSYVCKSLPSPKRCFIVLTDRSTFHSGENLVYLGSCHTRKNCMERSDELFKFRGTGYGS